MKIKDLVKMLSQFDENLDVCAVTDELDDYYLDIAECEFERSEYGDFVAIRVIKD
jgi:hypothetical protein